MSHHAQRPPSPPMINVGDGAARPPLQIWAFIYLCKTALRQRQCLNIEFGGLGGLRLPAFDMGVFFTHTGIPKRSSASTAKPTHQQTKRHTNTKVLNRIVDQLIHNPIHNLIHNLIHNRFVFVLHKSSHSATSITIYRIQ